MPSSGPPGGIAGKRRTSARRGTERRNGPCRQDRLNWELLGQVAGRLKGKEGHALGSAHRQLQEQEEEHLHHTRRWTRGLWLESLGVPAAAPAGERKDVDEAVAARAASVRRESL